LVFHLAKAFSYTPARFRRPLRNARRSTHAYSSRPGDARRPPSSSVRWNRSRCDRRTPVSVPRLCPDVRRCPQMSGFQEKRRDHDHWQLLANKRVNQESRSSFAAGAGQLLPQQ
jgi:hypothetical protein